VVSDVAYLARQVANGTAGQIPSVAHTERALTRRPFEDVECRHYLRFTTQDKPGVLSKIAGLLGRHGVSIASVHQDETGGKGVPIVIVTHRAAEGSVAAAVREADRLPSMVKKTVRLRIEDFR
jgi:homoserine dehydrogenase